MLAVVDEETVLLRTAFDPMLHPVEGQRRAWVTQVSRPRPVLLRPPPQPVRVQPETPAWRVDVRDGAD